MKCLTLALINASIFLLSMRVCAAPTPVYQINEAGHTWLQVLLTHDIYRYSADASLNNLLVLDNNGNKLPYRITVPPAETNIQRKRTPLRFFPVVAGASLDSIKELNSASIRIYNNKVSVELKHNTSNLPNNAVDFYILDISELDAPAQHLELDWDAGENHQHIKVQVSASRDLQDWEFIAEHTLVKLQKEGESLIRNTIPLDVTQKNYAYLRLKPGSGSENLQLNHIYMETYESQVQGNTREKWDLAGALATDQQSALRTSMSQPMPVAAWEYERKDRAPVSRLDINLGENHYGDSIRVYSRRNIKQPWQLLHQGIWFNVQVGDEWQHSDAISVYTNSDPYWRIELNNAARETHNPTLVFEQQQQLLQFVANNTAPYRVAFDNGASNNHRHIYTQIFSQLVGDKKHPWLMVMPQVLNPDASGFTQESTSLDWKTWLFWGALLMGVAILIGLAIRLLRQMKPS